ncbi:MAG: DUF6029 family protein [Prevotellaceae bacterium]|jgi:hypothetical protein|nr:DUF6029 family protein [Prevotellaceae bacterium]
MKNIITILCCLLLPALLSAQQEEGGVTLAGSLQSDMLLPQEDAAIGTGTYTANFLSNNYLNLQLNSKYITAGARLELLNNPLPGFEAAFAGAGLPNLYVTGKYKNVELTLGNVYDQFGSGLIFRSYEERSLGVDNSLRGGRFTIRPYKGISIKVLGGMQRSYFNYTPDNAFGLDFSQGAVWGGDLELNIDEWLPALQTNGWYLTAGASFVSKYQPEEDILRTPTQKLNLPEQVAAGDFRMRLQKGNWDILAEYAIKANDPSEDNSYIYKNGSALLLSGSYSRSGMSVLLQAKRSDNMAFRSRRMQNGTSAFINHLPAFSMTHTYALAAFYPYATQFDGEWAFQGSFGYTFKKGTAMGGRYGTALKLNVSHIRDIQRNYMDDADGNPYGTSAYNPRGGEGYTSAFFKMGNEVYYNDINVDLTKKISKEFTLGATYMYQIYNKKVIEGKGDLIRAHVAIADLKYQFSNNLSMRAELQGLFTKQDQGVWVYALYELALFRSLMLSVSDMYNAGESKLHYYMGSVAYTWSSHRLQAGFGRTRAGYNCSGGVCRYVPASKGVIISYNVNF